MNMTVLLAQLAGQRIALPAVEVDSVVELGKITPVPGTPSYIMGLSTLRSRTLTVIDYAQILGFDESERKEYQQAAVFKSEGHDYALLVELVEDVNEALTDPVPVPGGAGTIWSDISEGLIETKIGAAMFINPDMFIKSFANRPN